MSVILICVLFHSIKDQKSVKWPQYLPSIKLETFLLIISLISPEYLVHMQQNKFKRKVTKIRIDLFLAIILETA